MHLTSALSFVALALTTGAMAEVWTLTDTFIGQDFLSGFEHEAIPDPTHGRVNYVDQPTALSTNLTFASADTFIMRADSTTVLTDPNGPGRNSIRIKSLKTYTQHTVVFDVRHMPEGCATWPSAWEVAEATWPATGEIDIIEGVNNVAPNLMTLHTSPGCTQPAGKTMTGVSKLLDCDTTINGSQGCSITAEKTSSYGSEFNANGGGFFAMQRTDTDISIWFFARNDGTAPVGITNPGQTLDTSTFGEPDGLFTNQSCDFEQHFGELNIIFDLSLCGDFAGPLFAQNGCGPDCNAFVDSNPAAFANAFWDVASVRVYE